MGSARTFSLFIKKSVSHRAQFGDVFLEFWKDMLQIAVYFKAVGNRYIWFSIVCNIDFKIKKTKTYQAFSAAA